MEETTSSEPGQFMARWGKANAEGFVVFPRALVRRQAELGLDAVDVVLILNLVSSWWAEGDNPYPAVTTLARRIGISVRTVQRALRKLEKAGFIKRQRGSLGNGQFSDRRVTRYDLTGAVKKIENVCFTPAPAKVPPKQSEYNAGRRVKHSAKEDFTEVA